MPPVVHELVATEAALDKLGARSISDEEAAQLPANQHIVSEISVAHESDPSRANVAS